MDAAELTSTVRRLNGLSRAQLGKMSNLSPSTIGRIERRELDPSWSSMISILSSGGFQLERLASQGDVSAIAAARSVIDEDGARFTGDDSIQPWIDRWERAGLIDGGRTLPDQLGQIALLAGNASKIAARPGVRDVAYLEPWQFTANALRECGVRYAITGLPAAEEGDRESGWDWPVIYVDDPTAAAQTLGLAPASEGDRRISLVPFDRVSSTGIKEGIGGFFWVDRVQGLIDAYASAGRAADRADALVPRFERRALLERLSA